MVANLAAVQETRFDPWSGRLPGLGRSSGEGKGYLPTPIFWPREFHGQSSLAGNNPWCHSDPDMTEHTQTHESQRSQE